MTCDECRPKMMGDPFAMTVAERTAVVLHMRECPACVLEFMAAFRESERRVRETSGQEMVEAIRRQAAADVDEIIAKDSQDPEVREMLDARGVQYDI